MNIIECPFGHKRIEQSDVPKGCPYCTVLSVQEHLSLFQIFINRIKDAIKDGQRV